MRDLARAVLAAVGPVERPVGRQRPEQRRPLVGVDRAAHHVGGRQQHVVLHVEQPRGVVAALEVVAEVQEVVAVVLQVRALGRPAQQRPLPLGPVAELRQQRLRPRPPLDLAQLEVGAVQRVPHLGGERRAHRPAVLPRRLDAGDTLDGFSRSKNSQVSTSRWRKSSPNLRLEARRRAGRRDQRRPLVAIALAGRRHQRHAVADLEQPRHGLGPLHVAGEPVEVFRGPAEQHPLSPPAPRCP